MLPVLETILSEFGRRSSRNAPRPAPALSPPIPPDREAVPL